MIKHIVFFRFTDFLSHQERVAAAKEFADIFSPLENLDCVKEFRVGINGNSSQYACDVVIDSTFETMEDLENYSKSEEHQDAIKRGKKFPKEKSVVDYQI